MGELVNLPSSINVGDPGLVPWGEQVGAVLNKATHAATPSTLPARDAFGRLQVADPANDADAVTKLYVDTAVAGPVLANDAIVAGLVSNPASATAAALPTGRRFLGPRWVFDGDSITIGNTSTMASGNQDHSGSWVYELAAQSGGAIQIVKNTAVAGRSTAQAIIDFATNIQPLAGKVDVVCYEEITHSITNGLTVTQYLAQLDQYLLLVKGIGAQMVVTSGFPNATQAATINTWDRELIAWGQRNSVPVIPVYTLSDYANAGNYFSGWSTDGIHPNYLGQAMESIGSLAWSFLEPMCGPGAIPFAQYAGEGLTPNGFLTTLVAPTTGTVTGVTAAATTGTLPAGTYSYMCVTASSMAKTNSTATVSFTLGATGGVALTISHSGTFSKMLIYRKAPGDSQYYFLTVSTSISAFTDDGSFTESFPYAAGDFSAVPSGISLGGGFPSQQWPFVFTEAGTRGNIFRCPLSYVGTGGVMYYTVSTTLTPGTEIEVSFKGRVAYPTGITLPTVNLAMFWLRWITTGGASSENDALLRQYTDGNWKRFYWRGIVPTGDNQLRISLEPGSNSLYCDIAEIYVGVVPTDA